MSPQFSQHSKNEIETLHPKLRRVLREAIKHYDFKVLEGRRGKERQNQMVEQGTSQVEYPNSKHNADPSRAVDIAPWHSEAPHIRWESTEEFVYLAGYIMGIATMLGIDLRWGGDWDSDKDLSDETFRDYGHFELV